MPFTPINTLDCQADVKIFFSGLLILKPSENDSCEVFVHTSAPRHYLTIEVRRKQEGRPDEVMMRHLGPLSFIQTNEDPEVTPIHGMAIRRVSESQPGGGVKSFAPQESQPEGAPDGLDKAIDLARSDFHNASQPANAGFLNVDPLGARPSILLTDGTLYTAAKTRPELTIKLKDATGAAVRDLPRFASLIGANISLDDESIVTVSWSQQGKPETLNLIKKPGTRYEIYVINDPLFENDSLPSENNPKHDEFKEYYKVLQVPSDKQFRLDVEVPQDVVPPDRGSTRAPCMSVVISGGG
jgi:hypothetical protein